MPIRAANSIYGSLTKKVGPVEVISLYAQADNELRKRLDAHLSGLRRSGMITHWHDQQITPGEEWSRAIEQRVLGAEIIVLLISASFIASDHCYELLSTKVMDLYEAGTVIVVPVIVRPCDWKMQWFSKLRVLPESRKPVTSWTDPEKAFCEVAIELRKVIESLRSARGA